MPTCANHPDLAAQFQCVGCGRLLCGHCVQHDPVLSGFRCLACQSPATQLAAPPPQPPAAAAPQAPPGAPPGLVLDESSPAEAQYDPNRETATSIEALSVSTLNRYTSGMEDEGVKLWDDAVDDAMAPLRTALEAGDDAAALQAYQELIGRGAAPKLDSQLEAKLARVLDAAGMPQDAVQACRRIVMGDPHSPMAPGALFTGARLAAGRLGDLQMAARLLQFLIEKYPDSGLVPQARDALRTLASRTSRRG